MREGEENAGGARVREGEEKEGGMRMREGEEEWSREMGTPEIDQCRSWCWRLKWAQ